MRYLAILFLVASTCPIQAQVNFPNTFIDLADKIGATIYTPTEATDYKLGRVAKNPYQSYDVVLRSRKENLEIRHKIIPYQEQNMMTTMPHVQLARTVASVATNEDDAVIAYHDLNAIDLEKYGADWGQIVFLKPKEGFADEANCKFICLYKEEQGTIFTFLLFNEPTNEAVDWRSFDIKFEKLEKKSN